MYIVKKASKVIADAFDTEWEKAQIAVVDTVNWEIYPVKYNVKAQLLYSEYGLHVRMETDEKPLRITQTERNSAVCEDSCMEFFFKANKDDARYFNFEFNAMGTMYLNFRTSRYDGEPPVENAEYFGVQSTITPEKWVLFYTVPFEFMEKYCGNYTKEMLGNFYKCGDLTCQKHLLSYYPIKTEKPDFHRPEFFDKIVLE